MKKIQKSQSLTDSMSNKINKKGGNISELAILNLIEIKMKKWELIYI
jgi:hypothetical protein